jgi:signal transduction histidine kinase
MSTSEDRLLYVEAVQALPEPTFVVSSNGILLDANDAGLRIIGTTRVPPETPLVSFVTDSPERLKENLRIWSATRSWIPGRLSFRTPKEPLDLPVKAWCARPASADSPALVIVRGRSTEHAASRFMVLNDRLETLAKDVLDRRRVEAELVEALKARDDLVAVAAHELRNPLNVFHLTLQLLYRLSGDGGNIIDARRLLDKSRIQLSRLSALVDRLLDVTRLRSGKFELDREVFDLGELAREVIARLLEEFPAANISLETEDFAIGTWDRLRIDQVLTNVLSNAIKYGDLKPILMRISVRDDRAIVSVRDQGLGMSPGDLERIFDRFERAAPRGSNEGLGLGLWITKRIAQAHQGSILAESDLGKGSTFTISLPLHTP